jgi:predicted amidohydrolase
LNQVFAQIIDHAQLNRSTAMQTVMPGTKTCVLLILSWLAMPSVNAKDGQPNTSAARTGVTVRVAAISLVPEKFDLAGNADRLAAAFRSAHRGNAKIAVAPEGALDGYVVNEIVAGEVPADRMREVAIPMDHAIIVRFRELASELEMCLVFGFAELIGDDVFNCAVFIDNQGQISGKYHKMQFAEGYDSSWWFNRLGRISRAFDTPYGRCGILICNDRWNPQLAKIPVLDGAQFLLIPAFGSTSKSQDDAVLGRAKENGVPIVEANVGVTLVANDREIIAVDRQREGITFGEISIPPAVEAQPQKRDEVESAFLAWRREEMSRRWQQRQERTRKSRKAAK